MNNKKGTKRALFTSLLMLLLSCSMFVGSTYAWFTDSVVSKNNIITSGNLDVVLEYRTSWEEGTSWQPVDENVAVFKEGALYEPGYTEVVFLRVSNAGTLALKYNLDVNVYAETTSINVDDEELKLSDHLKVGTYVQDEYSSGFNYADILLPTMFSDRASALTKVGTLTSLNDGIAVTDCPVLPGEDTAQVIALVLTMPTEVGNEANHKTGVAAPTIELGIALTAAQYTHEEDSFDNQYDADAKYGEVEQLNYPRATVAATGPKTVTTLDISDFSDLKPGKDINLAFSYSFEAEQTLEEAGEYADWNADFVVTTNRDIVAGEAYIAGQYDGWADAWLSDDQKDLDNNWIELTADLEADTPVSLLSSAGIGVTYGELINYGTFNCGGYATDALVDDLTLKVELVLTSRTDSTQSITLGTYYYTFTK